MALSANQVASFANEHQLQNAIASGELVGNDIYLAMQNVYPFSNRGELDRILKTLRYRIEQDDAATAAREQAIIAQNVGKPVGAEYGQPMGQPIGDWTEKDGVPVAPGNLPTNLDDNGYYYFHPTGGYKVYSPKNVSPFIKLSQGGTSSGSLGSGGQPTQIVKPEDRFTGHITAEGKAADVTQQQTAADILSSQGGFPYGDDGTAQLNGGTNNVSTWADTLRGIESRTRGGRGDVFARYRDTEAFNRFLNPIAQQVMAERFNPLSSRYLLAAAPTTAGGYTGWNTGEGSAPSFRDFIGGGAAPTYTAAGGYGAPGAAGAVTGTGGMGMNPWTREQWKGRIGSLFGAIPEDATMPAMPTGDPGDYLGSLSMAEAANMVAQTQMAGLNPIAQRYAPAGINAAIAAWQEANPEAGGAQLMRSFVGGGMGTGRPVFASFV